MSGHRIGWPVSNGSDVRGCRCEGCRMASAAKQRAYYEQNRDEIAAKQRASEIEVAIARGWSTSRIIDELHVSYKLVQLVRARMEAAS